MILTALLVVFATQADAATVARATIKGADAKKLHNALFSGQRAVLHETSSFQTVDDAVVIGCQGALLRRDRCVIKLNELNSRSTIVYMRGADAIARFKGASAEQLFLQLDLPILTIGDLYAGKTYETNDNTVRMSCHRMMVDSDKPHYSCEISVR